MLNQSQISNINNTLKTQILPTYFPSKFKKKYNICCCGHMFYKIAKRAEIPK